jgi:catechol 2,3-dioxygenase-like lactoylglutathione lyase family enzyme
MAELNHTIVPARDKEASARFYERMFGFEYVGAMGHFMPVRIQSQHLTLDFDENDSFEPGHYAFKVSEAEFDAIFARILEAKLRYGSGPFSSEDMKINHWNGGRGVYFRDPGGHLLEILTRDYTPDMFKND